MVKPRFDGKGSEFGRIHRLLPVECGLFDVDGMRAIITEDTKIKRQNEGFFEYRTDFSKKEVKFVAMFEVKAKDTEQVRKAMSMKVGTAMFAEKELARMIGARFFVLLANDGIQPFDVYEYNYETDEFERLEPLTYTNENAEERVNEYWKKVLKLV